MLLPAHVDEDGEDQHDAENGGSDRPADAEVDQAIGKQQHQQAAYDRLGDRAASATDRRAAENGRSQCLDLQTDAGVGTRAAEACGEKKARKGAHRARRDISQEHHEADVDAGIERRAPSAADGGKPPARPHTRQTMCQASAITSVITSEVGTPRIVPSPTKSHSSDIEKPDMMEVDIRRKTIS